MNTNRMQITKRLLTTVVLSTIALSAYAGTDTKDVKELKTNSGSDAGFYVAVYGGSNFAQDYGNKRQVVTDAGTNYTSSDPINSNWGGAGGIKAGYNFESFAVCDTMKLRLQPAVEAEALYLGTTSTSSFAGPTDHVDGVFFPTNAAINTSYNSAAWFVNGILRFKNSSIVTPYIGIGAGGEYITTHGSATTNIPGYSNISGLNSSDVDFAGQALGGFDIAIAPHYSIFTEYKFIDAIGTDAKSANIGGTGMDYRFKPDQIQQHVIVAGVKYSF